jgi:hypothetical protein
MADYLKAVWSVQAVEQAAANVEAFGENGMQPIPS